MKVLGIDEAGRGALVGPLMIGGFMIDEELIDELRDAGVKDSKLLTRSKRRELYDFLKSKGECMTIKISPKEIDMKNKIGVNLNQLEINNMIKIIKQMKPDKVIIDCPSANESRIKALFEAKINCAIVCECKADYKYAVVGAGSILAKHERDESIKELEKLTKEVIGAGYPSDERTINFARKAIRQGKWQDYLRHSWETYNRLKNESEQRTLNQF